MVLTGRHKYSFPKGKPMKYKTSLLRKGMEDVVPQEAGTGTEEAMTDDGAGAKATVTKEEEGICEAEVALGQCYWGWVCTCLLMLVV